MNSAKLKLAKIAFIGVVTALTACASTEPRLPALDLPAPTATHIAGIERWWTQFSDPQLTTLIEEALAANLDLRLAVLRIDEARANLRLARSTLYPSLDADLGASRARRSQSTDAIFPGPQISNSFSGGLQAAYEVDLWGRLASGRNAAQAELLATRFSAETVRTALAAQVASTYFSLRALDAELQIARDTLGTRAENIKLQKQRFDAGLVGEYELRLSEAERSSVAAVIPALERAIAQSEAALAVLAGRSARDVYTPVVAHGKALATIASATSTEVPSGLPADLLARRPDIRQAEANLVSASARIDEARAQYFPSLILTGRFGGESADLSNLFSAPARVWSIAGSLLQPIIGAARIGSQVDAATSRRNQAEIGYVQSVQSAFRDAHNALVAHRAAREIFVAQDERRTQLIDALRLSDLRYRSGYSSFIDVLDNQRNLLDAERARVNALRDRQTALVDLYKALGGGWSPEVFAQTESSPR
ncbi:MAG: efflux transporter outer membrane subunit [Burkholderiaceae bacterium]|nr:efflux transporter outer membrane subunit [Burkholderiaceae bacterium]